jgi:hypothetical protein
MLRSTGARYDAIVGDVLRLNCSRLGRQRCDSRPHRFHTNMRVMLEHPLTHMNRDSHDGLIAGLGFRYFRNRVVTEFVEPGLRAGV